MAVATNTLDYHLRSVASTTSHFNCRFANAVMKAQSRQGFPIRRPMLISAMSILTNWEHLVGCVLKERDCGFVTLRVAERGGPKSSSRTELVDHFVEKCGLLGLGENWREISRDEAQCIATRILNRDMAYGVELMKLDRARLLAASLVGIFDVTGRFYTNQCKNGGFSPISDSSFDTGIVCVDVTRLGILWVQDED